MKKTHSAPVAFLTAESVRLLLEQPDTATSSGRRDMVLLSLLYDTGARVQELVDLSMKDLRLEHPAKVRLYGKGRKTRDVPLMDNTVALLGNYLGELKSKGRTIGDEPLFCNRSGKRMTRAGVSYILKKYFVQTKQLMAGLPDSISPHTMRHSKAMHLLQAGINIFYIKDLLGHADISSTEIYAHADIEMKREALSTIEGSQVPSSIPAWAKDENLLTWLQQF
jgi:site-specific recombinase XerD